MFSRIRNHEKLVENGENPSVVARKTKEGTYEKDDPLQAKKKIIALQNVEKKIEMTKVTAEEEEGVKARRPKNGTYDIEYNVSDIVDLHSYKDPKKAKGKKGKATEVEEEETVRYEGEASIKHHVSAIHVLLSYSVCGWFFMKCN